jgi:uncharacterized protein (TIGR02147 family)
LPYQDTSYRHAIERIIAKRKSVGDKITLSEMARATKIQVAYISNVLKGRAHFSADQLFTLAQYLELDDEATDYLLLLLDWERSAKKERRERLKARIDRLRKERLKTHKHLSAKKVDVLATEAAEYYFDPMILIVHVFLGVPHYAKHAQRIAEDLGLSQERLRRVLGTLERLGYVRQSAKGTFEVLVRHRHLPSDSPLCAPHQALMRLRSLEQANRLSPDERYQVSVTFSANETVKRRIQGEFLALLKASEPWVRSAPAEAVYQLNFDLFPWVASKAP